MKAKWVNTLNLASQIRHDFELQAIWKYEEH